MGMATEKARGASSRNQWVTGGFINGLSAQYVGTPHAEYTGHLCTQLHTLLLLPKNRPSNLVDLYGFIPCFALADWP